MNVGGSWKVTDGDGRIEKGKHGIKIVFMYNNLKIVKIKFKIRYFHMFVFSPGFVI